MKHLSMIVGALFFSALIACSAAVIVGRSGHNDAPLTLPQIAQAAPAWSDVNTSANTVSNSIHLQTVSEPFPVLWTILQFGAPCRVTIVENADRIVLAYPKLSVQLSPTDERISPLSRVDFISTVEDRSANSVNLCDQGPNLGPSFTQRKWRGFASLAYYRANH